ncbi:hypothetical protein DJ82_06230 [Halorubrum sp. Ib24]|nr:hypothetical protein DJ82_06230 [Halorubrum sp. Ib24]
MGSAHGSVAGKSRLTDPPSHRESLGSGVGRRVEEDGRIAHVDLDHVPVVEGAETDRERAGRVAARPERLQLVGAEVRRHADGDLGVAVLRDDEAVLDAPGRGGVHPNRVDVGARRSATCFRADEDHSYWESEPIEENARTAGDDD